MKREFYKPEKEESKSRLRYILQKIFSGGVEGEVRQVEAYISNSRGERYVGSMVVKILEHDPGAPETSMQAIKSKYLWLKRKGFPVLRTFRLSSSSNELLMTDVTHRGRFIIVDKHFTLQSLHSLGHQIVNLQELHSQIRSIAIESFSFGNGVFLGSDCFALVFNPQTSKAQLVLLDLGKGTFKIGNYRAKGRKHDITEELAQSVAEHAIKTYFSN